MNRLTGIPDKYRIEDIIATRPLTRTYRATDLDTGGAQVLKSLHYPLWFSSLERSAHERRVMTAFEAASEVQHPALAKVESIGEGIHGLFMSREWLDGVPLSVPLREQGQLPAFEVARIAQQCSGPLDALAASGLHHGAITADNLILRNDGTVSVTDHSFSKVISGFEVAGTRCGFHRRTPARSDIAALAELLYTTLVGLQGVPTHDPVTRRTADALRRAMKYRRAYASVASLADAVTTLTSIDIARQVWRPASTTGFLAAFGTICVLALSDERPAPAHKPTSIPAAQYAASLVAGGGQVSNTSVLDRFRSMTGEERNWVGLQIRRLGVGALLRPGVAEVFGLDAGQHARVGRILAAQREHLSHLVEAAATVAVSDQPVVPLKVQPAVLVKTQSVRERSLLAVLSNLDRDQITLWEWFTGQKPDDGQPTL